MLMFLPSIKPVALSPSMKEASVPGNAPEDALPRTPITLRDSRARTVAAHAMAPLRNATKSRRLIGDHLVWSDIQLLPKGNVISTSTGASVQNFTNHGR